MRGIFDTHAHYDDRAFDEDREEILSAMKVGGVSYLIHAGTNAETNRFGVSYAKKYDFFYTSVGIHPEDIPYASEADFLEAEKLMSEEKVVAVGEIGLDYHFSKEDKVEQINCFIEQIELANTLKLPILVHTRDASLETYKILKNEKKAEYGVLLHCFNPTDDLVR